MYSHLSFSSAHKHSALGNYTFALLAMWNIFSLPKYSPLLKTVKEVTMSQSFVTATGNTSPWWAWEILPRCQNSEGVNGFCEADFSGLVVNPVLENSVFTGKWVPNPKQWAWTSGINLLYGLERAWVHSGQRQGPIKGKILPTFPVSPFSFLFFLYI